MVKAPRCQWCKRILFPWQEQSHDMHLECYRDVMQINRKSQESGA